MSQLIELIDMQLINHQQVDSSWVNDCPYVGAPVVAMAAERPGALHPAALPRGWMVDVAVAMGLAAPWGA